MSFFADISAPVISGAPRCAPQAALSLNELQGKQPGHLDAVKVEAAVVTNVLPFALARHGS
jgi:hypothetical protein